MSETRYATYEEFWPYYVRAHAKPLTRMLHAVGTTAALGCIALAAVTRRRALVPLALVLGYGPAWVGHFFVEGNRPATFQYPGWSFRGDFDMLTRMLQGTMAAEVARCVALTSDPAVTGQTPGAPSASAGATDGPGDPPAAHGDSPDRSLH